MSNAIPKRTLIISFLYSFVSVMHDITQINPLNIELKICETAIQYIWFYYVSSAFFKKVLFTFRERVREGERGKETSICCLSYAPSWGAATQASALTRNGTGDLSGCRMTPNCFRRKYL